MLESLAAVVYSIRNTQTADEYIGSTMNLERRWAVHQSLLTRGEHPSTLLQEHFATYGAEAFVVDVLEQFATLDRAALRARELHHIQTRHPAYNTRMRTGYHTTADGAVQPDHAKVRTGAAILIHKIDDGVLKKLGERAAAVGLSREVWLRQQLERLAEGPIVRTSYALRAFGPVCTFQVARYPGGEVEIKKQHGLALSDLGVRQMRDQVVILMTRNAPGDREEARRILSEHFEQVFETHV